MIKIILFGLLIVFIFIIVKSNIHIKWKTLFKKGFKKLDNLFGIVCYCAKQGMGKTYCAVDFCEEQSKKYGYEIITNVRSYAQTLEKQKRNYKYFISLEDMINYVSSLDTDKHKVIIFFDEIFTTLAKSGSLKKFFLSFLSQLRKRKILLITTAQEWSEINITFRRYVRFQVVPHMFPMPFTKTAFIIKDINDGDLIHWDNDCQDFVAPTIEKSFAKGNLDVIQLYDTFETIATSTTSLTNSAR